MELLKEEGELDSWDSREDRDGKMRLILGIDGLCVEMGLDDKDYWERRVKILSNFWNRREEKVVKEGQVEDGYETVEEL